MKWKLILYTLVAALGGLLYGFDTAVINGALPFFKSHFQLNDVMTGWAVSSALLGCIIGAIGIGKPGDKYGRREMLKLSALLFLISAVGTGLAPEINSFILFRFIGGLAVGAASVLSPIYISEIAPATHRGRLIITFQLALVAGILVAFFVDYILIDTGKNNWRYMFISEVIPALAFLLLLLKVPKSPRWLMQTGDQIAAKETIASVNPNADIQGIVNDIETSITLEREGKQERLFKKPNLKFTSIGICIGLFSQFTGVAIVFYYATDIFRAAGFSTDSAIGQTVILGATNLIFTLIAMILIDKVGRKKLLHVGTLGMTVSLGVFSWAFYTGNTEGRLLLGILICYVAFFASSMGAVVFVLLAEIFPNNIRSRGVAIGSFSNWIVNGSITFLFPIVVGAFNDGKGIGYSFAFFSIMTLLAYFFFRTFLFETTNKTLEEIEFENK
ncbi:sugar porter family MFS transporter [Seonamhaeicola sp.]|uniref:sugar porter family MFS transporter n=1 Tax=Seonamhaeicola sp. TaxID=1912245 RepID=UPI002625F396|nr:sugar porter family MFS transporter [Seonamhaeicola sp.]